MDDNDLQEEALERFQARESEIDSHFQTKRRSAEIKGEKELSEEQESHNDAINQINKEWRQFLQQHFQFQQKLDAKGVVVNVAVNTGGAPVHSPAPFLEPSAPPDDG